MLPACVTVCRRRTDRRQRAAPLSLPSRHCPVLSSPCPPPCHCPHVIARSEATRQSPSIYPPRGGLPRCARNDSVSRLGGLYPPIALRCSAAPLARSPRPQQGDARTDPIVSRGSHSGQEMALIHHIVTGNGRPPIVFVHGF